jgi:uncharacterized membrane protein YidH (DUF202 family)
MKIIGVILIVIGLIALATGGLSWTQRETVLDVGPIEATAERHKTLPLPPLAGGAALIAGIVLVVAGSRKKGA